MIRNKPIIRPNVDVMREPADYPQMVRNQVVNCNSIDAYNSPYSYKQAVGKLEMILSEYHDDDYKKEKETLDKIKPYKLEELMSAEKIKTSLSYQKSMTLQRVNGNLIVAVENRRFEALNRLIARLKMYLEFEIEDEIK